ncbi:MAG: hypothetical protein R3F60_06130 [bacterium]
MRSALTLVALCLAAPAAAKPVDAFVAAGIGIPELLRVEFGWFAHERVSIEVLFGLPLLAPLGGVGVTGWLLGPDRAGRPPTHTLTLSLRGRVRVDDPGDWRSYGERLGAAAEAMVGYGLLTERHFLLRAQGGAFLYEDQGFAAAPCAVVTAGYAF